MRPAGFSLWSTITIVTYNLTIRNISGEVSRVRVAFDGWSSTYDYEAPLTFAGFRPCGWAAAQAGDVTLQEPGQAVLGERGDNTHILDLDLVDVVLALHFLVPVYPLYGKARERRRVQCVWGSLCPV